MNALKTISYKESSLLKAGHEVVVVDDCSNVAPPSLGSRFPPSLERVAQIVGDKCAQQLRFDDLTLS